MRSYVLKRLVNLIYVILGITLMSFVLANISPVDPAEAYVRRNSKTADAEQIERIREEMGFNRPVYIQYLAWAGKAVRLDLGESLVSGRPVRAEIMEAFPKTVLLVAASMLMTLVVALPVGIICAVYRNRAFDNIVRVLTLVGISIPGFWLGFVLMYLFSVKLKLVPVVGFGRLENILLPAATLAVPVIALVIRLLRANMLENINKDFVTYAKARGISGRKIIAKHVFKNALPPMITLLGQTAGYMVAGTAVIESIFSWPGMGMYAVKAIMDRDFPAVNAYVMIMAVVFVICNLFADVANMMISKGLVKEGVGF